MPFFTTSYTLLVLCNYLNECKRVHENVTCELKHFRSRDNDETDTNEQEGQVDGTNKPLCEGH